MTLTTGTLYLNKDTESTDNIRYEIEGTAGSGTYALSTAIANSSTGGYNSMRDFAGHTQTSAPADPTKVSTVDVDSLGEEAGGTWFASDSPDGWEYGYKVNDGSINTVGNTTTGPPTLSSPIHLVWCADGPYNGDTIKTAVRAYNGTYPSSAVYSNWVTAAIGMIMNDPCLTT